jgi:pimeloyl-ACP methyl ester carboxylesterase
MLKHNIVDNGHDEWVVFIHGIGGSTKTWKKQIELFSEKYNLLLLDLPGHGENADNIIHCVDPRKLNDGIKGTLDYLNIRSAHFVGLSLGTIVIANFAVQHPTYVKGIILGGAVLDICGIYRACVSFANGIKRLVPYKLLYKFFAWFMMPKSNHEKSRMIFLREVVKLNKETMFAWIGYLADSLHPGNLFSKLDDLGKNILFISGEEDHCFLRGSKLLANKLHTAEIKVIEHCGHICSIEKANIFNQYALSYLAAA